MKMLRMMRPCSLGKCLLLLATISFLFPTNTIAGELQSIRDEVRNPPSVRSAPNPSPDEGSSHRDRPSSWSIGADDPFGDDPSDDSGLFLLGGILAGYAVTSPIWVPRAIVGDDGETCYFSRYPYREGEEILTYEPTLCDWSRPPRWYSGRVRMEYAENFEDLWRAGGQIQFETASRFGIDSEAHRFEERLGGGRTDYLWLGDCNFTYRFAQSEKAAFRTGLGFNWLDDPIRTDFGFNFTYGFDLYPKKPWVFSTELDLGTLGKSDLFRIRTTAGIQIHRVETYIGYEYLDIANTTFNGLIAGLRISF